MNENKPINFWNILAVLGVFWLLVSYSTPKPKVEGVLWTAPDKPEPTKIQRARDCTVLVSTGDGWGSGVMVSKNTPNDRWTTYIWTDAHVVSHTPLLPGSKLPDVKVRDYYGREAVAEVIACGEVDGADLAVLRVRTQNWSRNSVHFSKSKPPQVGTHVFLIGCFYGAHLPYSYAEGSVSYVNRDFKYDQIDISAYPGSSGGGIFLSDSGECIGLCDAKAGDTILLATPVRIMRDWAYRQGLQALLP